MTSSISHCQWCSLSLSNQVAMDIKTYTIAEVQPVTYTVGSDCCIAGGTRSADYANEFHKKHNFFPATYIDFRPDPNTATILFAEAADAMRRSLEEYRLRLKTAWSVYDNMTPEDKARIVLPK
jgi:hypothetical protein